VAKLTVREPLSVEADRAPSEAHRVTGGHVRANMARLDTVAGDAWDKTKAEIDMDLSKLRASISDFDAAVSKH